MLLPATAWTSGILGAKDDYRVTANVFCLYRFIAAKYDQCVIRWRRGFCDSLRNLNVLRVARSDDPHRNVMISKTV